MKKSGMICAWLPLDDLPIYSASLAFVHLRQREGCSATPRRVCFARSGVEKKPLRVFDTLVRIGPLAHFPIERDLMVGVEDYVKRLEGIKPYLIPKGARSLEQREYLQTPQQMDRYS